MYSSAVLNVFSPATWKLKPALPFQFWSFSVVLLSITGIHYWMQWILVHGVLFLSLLPLELVLLQVLWIDCTSSRVAKQRGRLAGNTLRYRIIPNMLGKWLLFLYQSFITSDTKIMLTSLAKLFSDTQYNSLVFSHFSVFGDVYIHLNRNLFY